VSVPKPGMKFTIRLWADSAIKKIYRVHVYIDGTWDRTSYTLTDAHSTVIEYFIDENDKKKYNFVFASSLWTDEVNIKENNIHGFGSISVKFFEAEWTLKENENPSYTVIKDSNDSNALLNGLPYHTRFEESPLSDEERPLIKRMGDQNGSTVRVGAYYGWKSADKPSAVLTVHYRPKAWLISRCLTPDPFYSRLSPEPPSESESSDEYERDSIIYESEDEIERERGQLKKGRSRKHIGSPKYIDFNEERKRKRALKDRRVTLERFNKTSEGTRPSSKNNYRNIRLPANKSIEKCNGKKADNSRKDRKVSNTSNVKFARYFEEVIEETKFIDIEAGLNSPTEEIRRNKKLREIIEILDSDDD